MSHTLTFTSSADGADELLYLALERHPLPFALFALPNLICLFANEAWRANIRAAAVPGASASNCFPPDLADALLPQLAGASPGEIGPTAPFAALHASLKYWRFDLTWSSSGERAAVLVGAKEVTDATVAGRQQQETEYWLQLQDRVLQSMEEGVMIADAKGQILYTNASENRMFGYEPGELVGLHVTVLNAYPPEENEQMVARSMEELHATGLYTGTWHNRRKDGTDFFTHSYITVVGSGTDAQFICVQRNITTEKETLEALQQETKLKQTITDNATATLFMMNDKGYCTFMNPTGEQMFGYSQEEIRSRPLHYLIHHHRPDGSFYPMEECPIDRALPENNDVRAHEDLFFRKDGSRLLVSCAASPIFKNGVPVATVIEVRDITREKEAEQALKQSAEELEQKVRERTAELEAANEQLKQFAYAASHDLQEPLRKIHFFSDRLRSNIGAMLSESDRAMFGRMEHATQRMRTLIDDLLNYAYTSLGPHRFQPVDLNQLVREVLEDMEVVVQEKGATIHIGFLPILNGDPRQLRQLFQNLLSNALKYSQPEQAPHITVDAVAEPGSSVPLYRITVSDNGIGFAQADAERIFQVFQRLHGRSEYAGTGVGLAIVRRVVENHGGTITAESSPGQGARFVVRLPGREEVSGE